MDNNGLLDDKFKEIRQRLMKDANNILNVAASTTGHLGDIIASIRITMSSLELKANELSKIFNEQKYG